MEKIDNILFIDRFPKLDLHGYTSDIAALAVNDFINDNIKMKNEIIVIIHGIGTGTANVNDGICDASIVSYISTNCGITNIIIKVITAVANTNTIDGYVNAVIICFLVRSVSV